MNVTGAFGARAAAWDRHRDDVVGVFGTQLCDLPRLRSGMKGERLEVLGHLRNRGAQNVDLLR